MLEDNTRKRGSLAKMFLQSGTKPTQNTAADQDLFDLRNFRKGLRSNLVGSLF